MDREKMLANDPGEMYRGFRIRCKATGRLNARFVLYIADMTAISAGAKKALGADFVDWRQSWAASEQQARARYMQLAKMRIDYLYPPKK